MLSSLQRGLWSSRDASYDVTMILCGVFRGTAGRCDAKFRDARSGGGHGPQAADWGGGGCCDEGVPKGEKLCPQLQTDWDVCVYSIYHTIPSQHISNIPTLLTGYWTFLLLIFTVRGRAVSWELATPPAGRAGQAWKAAAAEGSQVRRRKRELITGYLLQSLLWYSCWIRDKHEGKSGSGICDNNLISSCRLIKLISLLK